MSAYRQCFRVRAFRRLQYGERPLFDVRAVDADDAIRTGVDRDRIPEGVTVEVSELMSDGSDRALGIYVSPLRDVPDMRPIRIG